MLRLRYAIPLAILLLVSGLAPTQAAPPPQGDQAWTGRCRTTSLLDVAPPEREALEAKLRFFVTDAEQDGGETFAWKGKAVGKSAVGRIFEIRMPSPVDSSHKRNDTIYAHYYEPRSVKPELKKPGIIVLHHLGGSFEAEKMICSRLAYEGIPSVFVWMPYYGKRKPEEMSRDLFAEQPEKFRDMARQAVADIRRIGDWLSHLPNVDAQRLGIVGVSLGSIVGSLTAGIDPRFRKNTFIIGGGDFATILFDGEETREAARLLKDKGYTKERIRRDWRVIEPTVYAHRIDRSGTLLLNAREDKVVPKSCTLKLWRAMGKPRIKWYSGGHYTIAAHLLDLFDQVVKNSKSEWF